MLNIDGASYGTGVGSAYAAAFPSTTGRLLLNGNAVVRPSTRDYYVGYAHATRHLLFKLESICEEMATEPGGNHSFVLHARGVTGRYELPCGLDGDDSVGDLMTKAASGAFTARTQHGEPFTLRAPMLYSYIVDEIQGSKAEDSMPWRTTIGVLSMLSSKEGPEWPRLATERVLDRICTGWYEYGLCKQAYTPALPEAAVNSLDYEGRYSIAGAMDLYHQLKRNYGPIEVAVANLNGFDMLTWPAKPVPPNFGWRAGVRALVVNSLYDGSTPYLDARWMRFSLPDATFLTWQGVGHCVGSADYDQEGVQACLKKMRHYMKTGELPVDGDVCRNSHKVVQLAHVRQREREIKARAAREEASRSVSSFAALPARGNKETGLPSFP